MMLYTIMKKIINFDKNIGIELNYVFSALQKKHFLVRGLCECKSLDFVDSMTYSTIF